jgi:ribonuclease D
MPLDPAAIADHARAAGRMGIDTEFVGEGRYQSLLCLVQIAVETGGGAIDVSIHDPLAGDLDPAPLAAVLADPGVEIVMHAGRQDVGLLRRSWTTEITNLFDTQIAAGFAGLRAQLGYEPLVTEVLGERLKKSASFTKWDARPLSEEQLVYAREDVLHLLQLASALQDRLASLGRLGWAQEECRALEAISDAREPSTVFARLPRINGLDPSARAVALELVGWREDVAREGNRPAQSVLPDAGLVEIAKRKPASAERLAQIRGLHDGILRRRGPDLLAAVERGKAREPVPVDGVRGPRPEADDAPLIALCEVLVRTRAMDAGLAYELIASRADLQEVVTGVRVGGAEPDVRTLQGWRRDLAGAELLELLAGRRSLRVGGDRRVAVAEEA